MPDTEWKDDVRFHQRPGQAMHGNSWCLLFMTIAATAAVFKKTGRGHTRLLLAGSSQRRLSADVLCLVLSETGSVPYAFHRN